MKRRVLIVDDERMVRVALRAALEPSSAWWEICGEAANGREMLELVRKTMPDLAVVDIRMPEMDGLAAIESCRDISPGTRYLVLSGLNDFDRAIKALSLGVMDYLLKPVRPADLARALARVEVALAEQAAAEGAALTVRWKSDQQEQRTVHCLYLYVDEPGEGSQRAMLVHHMRNVLPGLCRVGSALAVQELPDAICLMLSCSMQHPDAAALAQDLENRTLDLLRDWSGMGLVFAAVRFGPLHGTDELDLRLRQLQADRIMRFVVPGAGVVDLQWLADHQPEADEVAFLAGFDRLLSSTSPGDHAGREAFHAALDAFQAHAGLFPALPPALKERIRRLAKDFLALPEHLDPCAWSGELRRMEAAGPKQDDDAASPIVNELKRMAERDYMLDIGLKQAAVRLGLTPNYLSSLFRRHTGRTFVSYLTERRMEHARALLCDQHIPLKEVAARVGYLNRSYFDKVFVAATGKTPGEYRRCSCG